MPIVEPPAHPFHAGPFEKLDGAPRVSTPERAFLEALNEIGVRQPLPAAETRLGRRTALTFPLFPPPQKN